MDSSGVNNMSNAQICNDAVMASEWVNVDGSPMPVNDGYRLNLDGFPCLIFWANKINEDKELVREWDDGKITEPEFYGIGNFNYDKKPKALLGWDEDTFQGFEFRDNTSSTCLQKGIPNMTTFKNANVGFEWRWTYNSDFIDDYYDGNLETLMDGAYVDEDVRVYSEQEHINGRWDSESFYLKPYNYFYVEKNGEKRRLYRKMEDGTYDPISYDSWLPLYRKLNVFELEYGVRISTNEYEGKRYLQYQLPYGNTYSETDGSVVSLGSLYSGVQGYYAFEWRPDHTAQFKYYKDHEYFSNDENWTRYCPIDEVYGYADKFVEDEGGNYIYDTFDKEYHPLAYYTKYKLEGEEYVEDESGDLIRVGEEEYVDFSTLTKYRNDGTYDPIDADDEILTWDFMQDIFKNWYYCIDALSNCTDENFKNIIDSTKETSYNGKGLFCYNALLQYYCISLITGLCDNFAKNMFMHSYDEGQSWSPAWYDMD